jgi:hypothetical protein
MTENRIKSFFRKKHQNILILILNGVHDLQITKKIIVDLKSIISLRNSISSKYTIRNTNLIS